MFLIDVVFPSHFVYLVGVVSLVGYDYMILFLLYHVSFTCSQSYKDSWSVVLVLHM
jgi:hypothetical protein